MGKTVMMHKAKRKQSKKKKEVLAPTLDDLTRHYVNRIVVPSFHIGRIVTKISSAKDALDLELEFSPAAYILLTDIERMWVILDRYYGRRLDNISSGIFWLYNLLDETKEVGGYQRSRRIEAKRERRRILRDIKAFDYRVHVMYAVAKARAAIYYERGYLANSVMMQAVDQYPIPYFDSNRRKEAESNFDDILDTYRMLSILYPHNVNEVREANHD